MKEKKITVFTNLIWRFAERIGAQSISFVVSIILARMLDPSVYGTVALVTVLISILQVFIDCGFGNALVQKKDADNIDFSTIFYFNTTTCAILYLLLWIVAPWIASFYNTPELTPVVRVMGILLIISGVKNIQQAYVSKYLMFKRFFFATLGGTIGAAIIGIWMAFHGYGIWALVAQNLFNAAMDTIILWITVKWRPQRVFSFSRLKHLFSFGWKLLMAGLIDTVYNNLRQLLIGKIYTTSDLSFYNRGKHLPELFISNINSSLDSVLFPALSAEQEDKMRIKAMTRRAIKTSCYVIMPLMVGLAVCGEPLVRFLLTEKWLPSIFFMRIFCFSYAFWPIHTANLNAIKALGRSDLFLKLEIIKKIVGLVALFSTMWISVKAMAYSLLFMSITSQIINSWPNKKLLGYSYIDQLRDIMPSILLSLGMGAIIYLVQFLGLPDIITLVLQILIGVLLYVSGSKFFKLESFDYLLSIIKSYMHKTRMAKS